MGNEVTAQAGTKGLTFAVPAHLATAMTKAGGGNIQERVSTNAIHFGGKEWSITINGETKVLKRRTEDGEEEKLQILRVVVLDQGQRGRSWYESGYDEDNPRAPDCWSGDSKHPDPSLGAPQGTTCALCPKSAKGSGATASNPDAVACRGYKLLAVVPANALDSPPLKLKLATTSIWDSRDEEATAAGWYAWENYTKFLRANGVGYTNAMITRMRFASGNFPKIQFARGDFLDAEDFQKTLAVAQTDEVKALLVGFTPATPGEAPAQPKGKALPKDEDDGPAPDPVFSKTGAAAEQAQAAETAKAQAKAKADAEAQAAAAAAAAEAAKKAAAKAAKVAAAKAAAEAAAAAAAAALKAAEEDEDDGSAFDEEATVAATPAAIAAAKSTAVAEAAPPKKTAKKEPAAAPATAPAEVPPSLGGILGEWE